MYIFGSYWMTPPVEIFIVLPKGRGWRRTSTIGQYGRAFKAGSSRFYTLHVYPIFPPEKFHNGGKHWVFRSLLRNEYGEI